MQQQRLLKIRKLGKGLFEVKAFSYWAFSSSISVGVIDVKRLQHAYKHTTEK